MKDHIIHIDYDPNNNTWYACRHDEPRCKKNHIIHFDTDTSGNRITVTFDDPTVADPVSVPGDTKVKKSDAGTYTYSVSVNGQIVALDGRGAPGIIIE